MRVYFSDKNFDFPKKINDLRVAWYSEGKICISRNYKKKEMQAQNYRIIKMNKLIKDLYSSLHPQFKKDMSQYAHLYKKRYPHLRKRGMSAYAVFLMISYALIRRFGLKDHAIEQLRVLLSEILKNLSVADCIRVKLLKVVKCYYVLNHYAINKLSYSIMTKRPDTIHDYKCEYDSRILSFSVG